MGNQTIKMSNKEDSKKEKWHPAWAWGLGALIIFTLVVVFTEPVKDGDLWWQMAYGRHFIENFTLTPDHTAFTWSPTDGNTIYCAWIPEIFLYFLFKSGGLFALFTFRYLCLALFLFSVLFYALRREVLYHPLTWLITLLGILMSKSGNFLKPEIFSYILMTLTVMTWFFIKFSEKKGGGYCYIFPVLMLLWVNSHGGFIFGLTFLVVILTGELLNAFFSPKTVLPPRIRRHFLISLILSFFTIIITPYGWQYPLRLVRELLDQNVKTLKTVNAYASIFDAPFFHYADYLFLASLILLMLLWPRLKSRNLDWSLILVNIVFGFLYTRFLRTTFFWAPVFVFSAISLMADRPGWLWPKRRFLYLSSGVAICLVAIFLSGRACYDSVYRPCTGRFFGLGVSYRSPLGEAEFIRNNLAGCRLGNLYNSGGYLLWALWPDTKIFIDPRLFPFKKWYSQYHDFSNGHGIGKFLEKFPAEVWCLEYEFKTLLNWFIRSPDWKIAFYGPSAVIVVKKELESGKDPDFAGAGMGEIKNLNQALLVFNFSLIISDWHTAGDILSGMNKHFRSPPDRKRVTAASDFMEGKLAYLNRDYQKAAGYLKKCSRRNSATINSYLVACYNHMARNAWAAKKNQRALTASRAALAINPNDMYALFNNAVMEWYLSKGSETEKKPEVSSSARDIYQIPFPSEKVWKQRLLTFIKRAEQIRRFPELVIGIAEEILEGRYHKRPPLIYPPEPPLPGNPKGIKKAE